MANCALLSTPAVVLHQAAWPHKRPACGRLQL